MPYDVFIVKGLLAATASLIVWIEKLKDGIVDASVWYE